MDNGYFEYIDKNRIEELSHRRKELISMYRKAISSLSKIKCKNIIVDATIRIVGDEMSIYITTFDKHSDNCALALYDFLDTARCRSALERVIAAIRKDNFGVVKAESSWKLV